MLLVGTSHRYAMLAHPKRVGEVKFRPLTIVRTSKVVSIQQETVSSRCQL